MGVYTGAKTREINFPLGGIGTGSIGLGGNGRLIDWEIFNNANKNMINGYSHLAVKAKTADGRIYAKALVGDVAGDYDGRPGSGFGYGIRSGTCSGFPHFEKCTFRGEFPIATLDFEDEQFPIPVTMTAFNPFIPLDEDNSGIPGAFFEITFHNNTDAAIECTAGFSVQNPYDTPWDEAIGSTIRFENGNVDPADEKFGDMTIATDAKNYAAQAYWFRGAWQDSVSMYWREFTADAPMSNRVYEHDDPTKNTGPFIMPRSDHGTLCAIETIPAHSDKSVRFVLTWNHPNTSAWWDDYKDETGNKPALHPYYSYQFKNSGASAEYALKNWDMLYTKTKQFHDSMFSQTLDPAVIDAASATLSVLKTATLMRLGEDGYIFGWEGLAETCGSCAGTCSHVWSYDYALCFLFPKLERNIREIEYRYNQYEDGRISFRSSLPPGTHKILGMPCLDGQMSGIIRTYREWKLSGDNEWLRSMWPMAKLAMEFAWREDSIVGWDKDQDGVLEGRMHHTLDMELFGPSGWLQGYYLCGLKAAAALADAMGEPEFAAKCRRLFESGSKYTEANLFNGEYYFHKVDLKDKSILKKYKTPYDWFEIEDYYWNGETQEIKYQVGEGSEIDQMIGQWHSNICGLGQIFDDEHMHTALRSMMKNNFKNPLRNFFNPWRVFAMNGEAGAIMCDYPEGAYKPSIPITCCEEVMHGFQYSLGGLMISEGLVDEGLTVVRAVRDLYDGEKRNPWNEVECGSNYARSMASFALIPIFSGFRFDLPHGMIGFDPVGAPSEYKAMWHVATGWGDVEIANGNTAITLKDGSVRLNRIELPQMAKVSEVLVDGKSVAFSFVDGVVTTESFTAASSIVVKG